MEVEDGNSAEITREHVRLIKGHVRPRVAIFGAFNEAYAPLADIARRNWFAYAARHNYALRLYPRGYHLDPSHPESYGDKNRFNWYYDLKGHCEIAMFLDIDSLFTNMDVRIEDQLGQDAVMPDTTGSGPPTIPALPGPTTRTARARAYGSRGRMT